jgi:site-specific DNA-methyltransferase (adenine-specific)
MIELNKVYCGDCLEVMRDIPDKSIDLIVTDPPYNIGKDYWDKIPDYVEWMGKVFLECQRVLKDNSSFYWFHNNIPTISKLIIWLEDNTDFIFKQFIIWNKRFDNSRNKGYLDGYIVTDMLRNYQQMAEYLLFYTFQDETGLTTIKLDTNNFSSLRRYFKEFQEALDLTLPEINRILKHRRGEHCFYWKTTQWDMPTSETYKELCKLPLKKPYLRREYEDLRREYEDLRREYEDLRREYEDLRYTFNNQKTHHSVWNYDFDSNKYGYIVLKPIPLIENIIKHSSNEGDLVLDIFGGSGTTGLACKNLDRNYILIEKEEKYCEIARKKIDEASRQMRIF